MHPLAWPAILLFLGLLLLVLEVFVPSGGLLGFLSMSAIAAGIGIAFYQLGLQTGFYFLGSAAVLIPAVLALAFRYWPHTPMGRRMLVVPPSEEDVRPDNAERRMLRELVGKTGVARTLMLPSGAVEIDGRTIDAVSEGMPIEAGDTIEVVEVRGTVVIVRPFEGLADTSNNARQDDKDDILSRPIDSLGLDPFDDPLA